MLPPNAPAASGKEAAPKAWSEILALPGLVMSWQPTKVEITKSGDIGYTRGTYEMTVNDAKGNPHTDRASIFRSGETDGAWKCIVDTFNSDLPAVPSK